MQSTHHYFLFSKFYLLILFSIFYFLFSLYIPLPVQAQVTPSLSISPAKYDFAIEPSQVRSVDIRITNTSDMALPLKMQVLDFSPKDNKGAIDFSKSIPGHSAVSWFQIKNPDLVLNPSESRKVEVSLIPPDTLQPGSYFAVVMFQAQFPEHYFQEDSQAHIVPWIGTLFLLKYGEPSELDRQALVVKEFKTPFVSLQKEIPASLEIQNNTNFHLTPDAEFELRTLRGNALAKLTTEDTTVMPGMSRLFEVKLTPARLASVNFMTARANIKYGSFEKKVTSGLVSVLTWVGIVILALGALSLYISWRHRHRIHHHVRRIFRKGQAF